MGECSQLVGWLTVLLLFVTAVIVAFYTRETYRLRREAERQTELQNRPFLIIECPRAGLDGEILIRNAGKGVAINVSMVTAAIGNDTRIEHVGLMHLQPGEARAPSLRVSSQEFGTIEPLRGNTDQQQAIFHVTTRSPVLHLEYESNVRQRYRTSFALEGTTVKLLEDARL